MKTIIKIFTNFYSYWVKILTIIAKVKIFPTPGYIIYDPSEFDYKVRGNSIREISQLLRPGDIVLRGYDHYLDNFMIPGKYSHSGIYIGDNKIIHAIATGVQEVDVIDFFQTDRACVLRPNYGIEEAVNFAKSYLGKKYDFKFDTKDSDEFYCHELVAKCYNSLPIQSIPVKFCGISFEFLGTKFLADSFLTNENIKIIIEL